METPGTSRPDKSASSAPAKSEQQKLPTIPMTDMDEPVIRSMGTLIADAADAALIDYRQGAYGSRSMAKLGGCTRMVWAIPRLSDILIPEEIDPHRIASGRRMLALAGLASAESNQPVMDCDNLVAHMAHADAQGRYGEEPLQEPSPAAGVQAASADPDGILGQDDEIADLVAAAEREIERLTPAYENLRARVRELAAQGEVGSHPEFDQIRAEAAKNYSPLAHIALKAELARQTALYRGDRSSDRFRLVLSLARELSFSFALLAAAESQNDENTLGIGQQSLISPEEVDEGLSGA